MNAKSISRRLPPLVVLWVAVLPISLLFGRSFGVLNGEFFVPPKLTMSLPSCGSFLCHATAPNSIGTVKLDISVPASIQKGSTAIATVKLSGGVASTLGGFSLSTDKGKLTAGLTTRTNLAGTDITHTRKNVRSWSFNFSSAAAGLVKWHAAGNTVNGNFFPTGDSFGFYGPNSSKPGTPFRIFVNDAKVFPFGFSCTGTAGFKPVIGMANNATIGRPLTLEVHNVPPGVALTILGLSNTSWGVIPLPLPLTALGATGCHLRVSFDASFVVPTLGSGLGNGVGKLVLPLPNLSLLKGLNLYFQAIVVDPTANPAGLTTSMGLRAVIQ